MKVAAILDTAVGIPGDQVANTLLDVHVAVWADPGLAVFCVRSARALHGVLDAVLDFSSFNAAQRAIEINFYRLFAFRAFRALRAVAAWH